MNAKLIPTKTAKKINKKITNSKNTIQTPKTAQAQKTTSPPKNIQQSKKTIFNSSKFSKLEIGPGSKPREGYLHFDIRALPNVDVVGNAKELPFKDNSFEEVFSRFFLEHMNRKDAILSVKEMFRVLKSNGRIELIVPNLKYFCKLFVEEKGQKKEWALNKIYGFENYPEDHHFFGYDAETLSAVLQNAGFVNVKEIPSKENQEQYLCVEGKKP
jgi:predicted SAM-dependent methyltransferase